MQPYNNIIYINFDKAQIIAKQLNVKYQQSIKCLCISSIVTMSTISNVSNICSLLSVSIPSSWSCVCSLSYLSSASSRQVCKMSPVYRVSLGHWSCHTFLTLLSISCCLLNDSSPLSNSNPSQA